MKNNNQPQKKVAGKQINVQLLLDRVIVEPIDLEDEVRDSGIVITKEMRAKHQNLPRFGRIRAAGPGDPNRGAMTVKVGDLISFLFYSGTPFEFNGTTHLIMREWDIIMIVNE